MHGRARFTPSCAQRCRSARPLSRQAQPVVASRIALQRSGEQLSTNREKGSSCPLWNGQEAAALESPWHAMASGRQPATGLECVFLIWHNLRHPCYVDPNGRCMGGPGLHPAVRSDAGPRAHSVARISQFLLRALLCKGLASSCAQTENKEAARLHHVVPTAQCMLWARFARWWHCTLRALAFGLRHRVSGPPISSQSESSHASLQASAVRQGRASLC